MLSKVIQDVSMRIGFYRSVPAHPAGSTHAEVGEGVLGKTAAAEVMLKAVIEHWCSEGALSFSDGDASHNSSYAWHRVPRVVVVVFVVGSRLVILDRTRCKDWKQPGQHNR